MQRIEHTCTIRTHAYIYAQCVHKIPLKNKIVHSKYNIVWDKRNRDWTDENAHIVHKTISRVYTHTPKKILMEMKRTQTRQRQIEKETNRKSPTKHECNREQFIGICFVSSSYLLLSSIDQYSWMIVQKNLKFTCTYRIPCSCCISFFISIFFPFVFCFGTPQMYAHCTLHAYTYTHTYLSFQIQEYALAAYQINV